MVEEQVDGGDEGDRTLDLRIANATLSQLSYVPTENNYSAKTTQGGRIADARRSIAVVLDWEFAHCSCLKKRHDTPADSDRRCARRHRAILASDSRREN